MDTSEAVSSASQGGGQSSQFLTFTLAGEEYGVDILKVQEIKGYVATTRVPNSPPEVVGVLNLRGTIVPIVDLRRKFGLEEVAYDAFAAIVVVVVDGQIKGMVVDRVSEVISIPNSDIQPATSCGAGVGQDMLAGMAQVESKLIILLDVDAVLIGSSAAMALSA